MEKATKSLIATIILIVLTLICIGALIDLYGLLRGVVMLVVGILLSIALNYIAKLIE